MKTEIKLNEENESYKYAFNSETDIGWNAGDLTVYGEMCRMEGMIEIAKHNGLDSLKRFWEAELQALVNQSNGLTTPEK